MSDATLPERADLRHLKDEAKALLRRGGASRLADAQRQIARRYGFASWPRLKAHVDAAKAQTLLKAAIARNDLAAVQQLVGGDPGLHRAPIGYGRAGPLSWAAECRVPREAPGPERLAIVRWLVENGSDIHQDGDAPLMRAALDDERIAMMALLVELGADVNAAWRGQYPMLFAPCESLAEQALAWLLGQGTDPDCRRWPQAGTALDYLLGGYLRDPPRLAACIRRLRAAGGSSRLAVPGLLEMLEGDLQALQRLLDADPGLLQRRHAGLGIGGTAGRLLTLRGATLLHAAAEFLCLDAARLLLERGADPNAQAEIGADGLGGQTPLFHAATQSADAGLALVELLLAHGADPARVATVPGSYESPDERLQLDARAYARRFGGPATQARLGVGA